jgi:hypothetical protein
VGFNLTSLPSDKLTHANYLPLRAIAIPWRQCPYWVWSWKNHHRWYNRGWHREAFDLQLGGIHNGLQWRNRWC